MSCISIQIVEVALLLVTLLSPHLYVSACFGWSNFQVSFSELEKLLARRLDFFWSYFTLFECLHVNSPSVKFLSFPCLHSPGFKSVGQILSCRHANLA